jgi:hypothetical protein
MLKAYVIHKKTHDPGSVSYAGATWDDAGIRNNYQQQYFIKEWAEQLAEKLTKFNPVGFEVTEVKE